MPGASVIVTGNLPSVTASPVPPTGAPQSVIAFTNPRAVPWSFLFGVELTAAPNSNNIVNVLLWADFDLTVVNGSSTLKLGNGVNDERGFARLVMNYQTPIVQPFPFSVWSTVARTPVIEAFAGALGPTEIGRDGGRSQNQSYFPAEEIDCSVRVGGISDPELSGTYTAVVHAAFAPFR